MKSNKYLIEKDFVVFACLMLFACIIIWVVGYLMVRNERFNAMQYTVISLANSAIIYDLQLDLESNEKVTVKQMNEKGIITKIINPFNTDEYCSDTDSYIIKNDKKVYVTLSCGHYYVKDYYHNEEIDIYLKNSLQDILVKRINMKESDINETKQ